MFCSLLESKLAADSVNRILVIYVSRIGDTMLITPSIRALHQAFPSADIDFVGSKQSYVLFRYLPYIKNTRWVKKLWVRFHGWLNKYQYDLALVYGYDKDEAFVKYALRQSKKVISFRQACEDLNNKLFAVVDKPVFGSCHSVDHFFTLPSALGLPMAGRYLSYQVSEQESLWASEHLFQLGIADRSPLIGLQTASFPTRAYRDWPIENFLKLANEISAHYSDAHFVVLGGALESERTEWLVSQLGKRATLQAGKLSLRHSVAVMNCLDLYIGVDTGPTHIMGALHKPMVAMYHGLSPSYLLAPLEHPCCTVIDHPRAGKIGLEPSMNEIPVSKVRDAALDLLRKFPRLKN